jgi:UDP-glucuronate 4-epimerase
MRIIVTGACGFIGFHVCNQLLKNADDEIYGLDNLNDYYDPELKKSRLNLLEGHSNFSFSRYSLQDKEQVTNWFRNIKPELVIHLAAQAGVRHSLTHPHTYIDSNLVGFLNVLECCRWNPVKHLVYASSSSVYGLNTQMPFSTERATDHPVSLYAATKKANELMAHSYSHLYNIPCTGLRFFTVYGPWGRPDMALFLFTKAILEGREIEIFGEGKQKRDFTYIDDIVGGILRIAQKPPVPRTDWREDELSSSSAPWRVYNIGNHDSVPLMDFIEALENALGIKAIKVFKPMQLGDVKETFADIEPLMTDFGYKPSTNYRDGIKRFVDWYRSFYAV